MLNRWVVIACLGLATSGCAASAAPATSTTTSAHPPAPAPPPAEGAGMLGPDGQHFATERIYEGECAPPGSRGGCHTLTLRPDGTFRNFLFDAALVGTYVVEGSVVRLTPSDPAMVEELALSPDGTRLGDLQLKR